MMLEKLAATIDGFNERVGRGVAWLNTLLVLLVCFEVALSMFNRSANWLTELEWHVFALIFLLGAGYAFKHDRHVRVDLFYTKFSPKDRALTDLIGNILFLIPWCIAVAYFSFFYAVESWKINESSPDPGGLPARYFIKFSIVVGMLLLLLQAISSTLKSLLIYTGKMKSASHPDEIQENL
ncbi:MAG: TRAP transporter small permease subunit [Saprospiraceae bacterium]|nr:TRAP transporter small permease subunit [Saprospiraceae bacterium]